MAQDTCPFHALLPDSTLDYAQRISIDLSESSFVFAQNVSRFAYLFSSHSLSKSSSLFSSGASKSEILRKSLNFSPSSIQKIRSPVRSSVLNRDLVWEVNELGRFAFGMLL